MPNISSHVELATPLSAGGVGLARITKGNDRWQYALPGHTQARPRTLTVTRIGANGDSTTKRGWKFVISVLSSDADGAALPAPAVGVLEIRSLPDENILTVDAIVHLIGSLTVQLSAGTDLAGHTTDTGGSLDYGVVVNGYELPEGRFMPVTAY